MQQISVVGLGVNEHAQLSEDALQALGGAQLVIGSERQLQTLAGLLTDQATAILPKLKALAALIADVDNVVILGSGDPLYYGIGRWIKQQFTTAQVYFYPALSSITVACHSLGFSQQDIKVHSLHGRPLATLKVHLKAQRTLLLLTDKHSQPQHLAQLCHDCGFDNARLIVCERLGYGDQQIRHFDLDALRDSKQHFDALHVTFIVCGQNQGYLPEFPGIEDQHFVTGELGRKGMISKRAVRLAILSLLQPSKDDLIWDIGAGCGGVAVELAYWQPQAKVYAIEHHQGRFECLQANQEKFGVVSNLMPNFGRAPDCLTPLPQANKIFIGGSDGELATLLARLWAQLPEGGQIVATAVMERTKSQLLAFYEQRNTYQDAQCDTLQVAVNNGDTLAGQLVYRPALTVSLFSFIKRSMP